MRCYQKTREYKHWLKTSRDYRYLSLSRSLAIALCFSLHFSHLWRINQLNLHLSIFRSSLFFFNSLSIPFLNPPLLYLYYIETNVFCHIYFPSPFIYIYIYIFPLSESFYVLFFPIYFRVMIFCSCNILDNWFLIVVITLLSSYTCSFFGKFVSCSVFPFFVSPFFFFFSSSHGCLSLISIYYTIYFIHFVIFSPILSFLLFSFLYQVERERGKVFFRERWVAF